MYALSSATYASVERVLRDLATWHILEALALRQDGRMSVVVLASTTAQDVTTVRRVGEGLARAGVAAWSVDVLTLTPTFLLAARELVQHVRVDSALRRTVLKLAALREFGEPVLTTTVVRPQPPARYSPGLGFSVPATPHSLAASVPVVRGPNRSTGRGAPAA